MASFAGDNASMSTSYSTFVGPAGVGTIVLPVSPLSNEKYLRMIDGGILGPEDKVELIGGAITNMAPAGPEHGGSIIHFPRLFAPVLDRFEIGVQVTLVLAEGHVYDPDFMLLRRKSEGYRRKLPRAEDVRLVIESASSSLDRDRHVKLPVYAAAGIEEYWIADVEAMTLTVFRQPEGARYAIEATYAGDQTVSPLACPDLTIRAGDIFA